MTSRDEWLTVAAFGVLSVTIAFMITDSSWWWLSIPAVAAAAALRSRRLTNAAVRAKRDAAYESEDRRC